MDDRTFDRLARQLAEDMPRRRVLTGLGLGLLGALGLARSDAGAAASPVEVCHVTGNGGSMRLHVAQAAVAGHLRHGDDLAAPLGVACVEITPPGGGFDCVPPDGLSGCGAECVGAAGAGDGRCANTFVGCVPDGRPCSEFTTCCSDACGSPSGGLIARCGACVGSGSGPCLSDADCCGSLTCQPNAFGGVCA